jgi:pimeloyl-ACP methyl ester carboxylesterase
MARPARSRRVVAGHGTIAYTVAGAGAPLGQTVSANRHLKQLAGLPILLAWGSEDRTVPPAHYRAAVSLLGATPFIEITGAGHYPQETDAAHLLPAIQAFPASTVPFRYSEAGWRRHLVPR